MSKTRLLFAFLSTCLVAGLTLPTLAQSNPPKIEKVWSSVVGSTTARLSMNYNAQGLPSRGWFDVSTNSGMSGAKMYGERQNQPSSYTWTGFHQDLSGLAPETTYYFRGIISSPAGKTESSVGSFKTGKATAPQPPTISFTGGNYNSDKYYTVSFTINGKGLGGTAYVLWSKDSSLAGAQRMGQQSFSGGPTGQGFNPYFQIKQFPDKTKIYFQGVVETSAGTAKTGILNFEVRNAPY